MLINPVELVRLGLQWCGRFLVYGAKAVSGLQLVLCTDVDGFKNCGTSFCAVGTDTNT